MSKDPKTAAEKVSLDLNATMNILERRLKRVSGLDEVGIILCISVPNQPGDIDSNTHPGRVLYSSNVARKDGIDVLASLFIRWLERGDDNAYFVEKKLEELKK